MIKALTKKDIKEVFVETLEPFARAVQGDFKKIDERLGKIDGRLDKVDGRLDSVEINIAEINRRLTKLETEFQEIKNNLFNKLDKFIGLYDKQAQEFLILSAEVRRLEDRVVKLEAKKR